MHRRRDATMQGYATILKTILASGRPMGEPEEAIRYNNLYYCGKHGRDVCNECEHIEVGFAFRVKVDDAFKIPENGQPEYPVSFDKEDLESILLAKRWLDMQKVLYSAPTLLVTCSHVQLPELKSRGVQAHSLVGMFRQLLSMCATQRYFYANQPHILMQDLETFEEATHLYETQLHQSLNARLYLTPNRAFDLKKKASASLVHTFGLLLHLKTRRTFWRSMELTTEAYITLLHSYSDKADDHVVLTGKANSELLQWIGHVYWSLKHAQDVLYELMKLQHVVYQDNRFPFYPWSLDAIKGDPEGDLDVHLLVTKLSRGPAYDLHVMGAVFSDLRRASDVYPEQMVHVNSAMMVAIDEMSARFRVLELLTHIGQVFATRTEVKKALFIFKFDEMSVELHSTLSDAVTVITEMSNSFNLRPTPKIRSFLQELLVLERDCRIKHREEFLNLPEQDLRHFTTEVLFNVFQPTFIRLDRESLCPLWKVHERSLLSSKAQNEHRLAIIKRKSKKKASTKIEPKDWETELAEARRVPKEAFVDPSLFWTVGDGCVERYKPPILREKIKSQKMSISTQLAGACLSSATSPPPSIEEASRPMPRSLNQLKESDLVTRDILWRKVKGSLRWSTVVQFLARLGCSIISLDGSKKKVVDEHTGRCTVLHRPHPSEECRRDQLDGYRMQLEDWLLINYEDVITSKERNSSSRSINVS